MWGKNVASSLDRQENAGACTYLPQFDDQFTTQIHKNRPEILKPQKIIDTYYNFTELLDRSR
jgi:hypothetical protein